ncbi:MAG: Rnf-Nqr domain containing protein [Pseudomonadota bacterium]
MGELAVILIGALLVNNFVLAQFLGLCPFMGITRGYDTAAATGIVTTLVLCLTMVLSYPLYHAILVPLEVTYLRIIAFIAVTAGVVAASAFYIRTTRHALHQVLGSYLPLITTNCAVLGVALLATKPDLTLLETSVFSIGAATGFTIVMVAFGALREQLTHSAIPAPFQGIPIALISAGIMSLALMGFVGVGQ